MKNINKILAPILVLLQSSLSLALNTSAIPGEKVTYTSAHNRSEICVVPEKLFPAVYDLGDVEDEKKLCSIDFYSNYAVCPKQNSTNPGVLITKLLPNLNRDQTMALCEGPDESLSVKAKFKNSISCSYTPAILAYYHFSKILKTGGNIPTAVVRTMDKEEHLAQVDKGLSYIPDHTDLIYKSWESFKNQHTKGTSTNLFDDTKEFIYGALVENPKHEYQYTEVSGVGQYDTRYERFIQQKPYLKLTDTRSVQEIAESAEFSKLAPVIVQMKDVSDMILLDTMFSQDDRIGNIHYRMTWYTLKKDEKTGQLEIKTKKSDAELSKDKKSWIIPEAEKPIQAAGGMLIREMLLKDNDCGVNVTNRSNMMRMVSALEGIRHMSASTYKKFMEFYKVARNPETIAWMKNTLLFTNQDLGLVTPASRVSFLANLDKAHSVLLENCKSGLLKLDLNINEALPGAQIKAQVCE